MSIVTTQPVDEPVDGLALYREDLGLSQDQAAQLVGVSRRQLRRLELDPHVTPAAIRVALMYVALRVLVGGPPFLGPSGAAALVEVEEVAA